MNKVLTLVWGYLWQLFGRLPFALPTKDEASLEAYTTLWLGVYGVPNLPPYREALAQLILQMPAQKGDISAPYRVAPYKLIQGIKKAMANELAWQVIQRAKEARAAVKPALSVAPQGAGDGAAK